MPAFPALGRGPLPAALLFLASCSAVAAEPLASGDTGPSSLDRIVVTAAGFAQMVREAPASISVITREQLQSRPFHGLAEALAGIEGVDVEMAWDKTGAPSIAIRGMPSDYTLVLIDGRRQNAAGNVTPNGFGGTQNNFIPPLSAIDRIEVIRGPMSTLYGSDAMGGVVNIITRREHADWGGTASVEATLPGDSRFGAARGAQAWVAGPLSPVLSLSAWGGVFRREASRIEYASLDGDSVRPWMGANPVAYDQVRAGARLDLEAGEDHALWLDAWRARQAYDNSEGQVGTLGSGGYAPVQRYHRDQATLAWDGRFAAGDLHASLMGSRTETLGRLLPGVAAGAGAPRELVNDNVVLDAAFNTVLGDHVLTVGGQYWDAEMVDGAVPEPFAFEQWALFAEDEWSLGERIRLTLGARRDDHSTFGAEFSPRAYLVFNAHANWVLKGGISRGYKTPRLEQLATGINGYGRQGTLPLVGSPELGPETSTTTEVGVFFAGDAGGSASVTLFHNAFDDKIASGLQVPNCSYAPAPNRPGCVDVGHWPDIDSFGRSINIDRAVTRGAELALRLPLAEGLELSGNYTYTESEQKSGAEAGLPLAGTPRQMANAGLQWEAGERLDLWLRGQYRSSRYRGAGAAQDALGDYKPYAIWHLGGSWQASDTLELNAAIHNLFDKDFVAYAPYVSNLATGALSYGPLYANNDDGRQLWLSLAWTF